jgi:hypothetical protein
MTSINQSQGAGTLLQGGPGVVGDPGVSAYDESGHLLSGDWAGDVGDTNNAMDDLLKSEDFNNGRMPDVHMVENVTSTVEGGIIIRNDNTETAVKGIVEETEVSTIFFSEMNTKVIQDTIRYGVWKQTEMVVAYQSTQELYIIMRSILLQHANFKVAQKDVADEIRRLNKMVVDYSIKEVSSNVRQYDVYIQDIQTLPTPIARPEWLEHSSRNRSQDMTAHIGISQ